MTLYKRGQGQPPQGLHPITGSDRSVVAVFSHADSLSPLATIGETANKSSLDKLDKWKISDEYHYEDHSISEASEGLGCVPRYKGWQYIR